ncbi:uncharacterized protein TA15610 [Theileria annulata]|uniref:Uncharacterized protein n=1 Tax=Theileria annulata TaxID=5874 RepID=Q4UFK9_THEAN|nr:uncharacterized protein TA15610 [Theileria annulata]CAI74107.1 hypothetical protein, conserved [Theileria annulata]|eukprot:XP_951839.1 hypothetical protein, conserved [Theileria annulata]
MNLNNEKLDINDKDWPIFERHLTKWITDNSRNLTTEETKYFKNATFISITTGISSGYITHTIFNKLNVIPNIISRRLISIFTGLYTSAFTLNKLRKKIYLKLLDSNGPAGNASRKILKSTKELNLTNDISPIYLPNYQNKLNNRNLQDNTYTNSNNNRNSRSMSSDRSNDGVVGDKGDNTSDRIRLDNTSDSIRLDGTGDRDRRDGNDYFIEYENKYKTWDDIRNQSN